MRFLSYPQRRLERYPGDGFSQRKAAMRATPQRRAFNMVGGVMPTPHKPGVPRLVDGGIPRVPSLEFPGLHLLSMSLDAPIIVDR